MSSFNRRRQRTILRRWGIYWINRIFLIRLLFIRRWLKRQRISRITGDNISNILNLQDKRVFGEEEEGEEFWEKLW